MKTSICKKSALMACLSGIMLAAGSLFSSCSDMDIYPVSKRTVPEDYHPYVVEGKRWNFKGSSAYHSYFIQGDTLIGQTTYKKLFYRKGEEQLVYFGALRENAMQVILIRSGNKKEELLFDFGVHVGDKMKWHGYETEFENVDDVFIISMGNRFRSINATAHTKGGLHREVLTFTLTWIEGIGMREDALQNTSASLITCYEGDICIYDWRHEGSYTPGQKTEPFDPNVFSSTAEERAFHEWVEQYPDSAGYLNLWFEGRTLCVKGIMWLGPYPAFAECFKANYYEEDPNVVNEIKFSIYQHEATTEEYLVPSWVNLRIDCFEPGTYHFVPNNRWYFPPPVKECTLECEGI